MIQAPTVEPLGRFLKDCCLGVSAGLCTVCSCCIAVLRCLPGSCPVCMGLRRALVKFACSLPDDFHKAVCVAAVVSLAGDAALFRRVQTPKMPLNCVLARQFCLAPVLATSNPNSGPSSCRSHPIRQVAGITAQKLEEQKR